MKVLFVTSEAYPFATSGGLGDVSGSLPKALRENKVAARVVMPLYGDIAEEYRSKMKFICSFNVPVAWRTQYCGLFELNYRGVCFYFLDNEYYFKRSGLYGYYDDAERYAFFSRAVLEMLCHTEFEPDIIHANDWQSALVNVYINLYYRENPKFYAVKTLLTIHNIQYQGKYGTNLLEDVLGIGGEDAYLLEYGGCVNFLKGAITCSDRVNTVSPSYAEEILDPWFSHGLDGLLREYRGKLSGILNGIDTEVYDPADDRSIAAPFSAVEPAGKEVCKKELIGRFGLEDKGAPIIGIVSRLVAHKGFDLIKHVLEYILLSGMQVVVLGSGEYMYESCFAGFAKRYPGSFGLELGFIPDLARKIYAGSDLFLMPSRSEPCGLSQMIALRYGTLPIVRETGGLKDTITDCGDGTGNGFTFKSYNAHDMLDACMRAKTAYEDRELWPQLVTRALGCDFSWKRAAASYTELYREMLELW